MNKYEKVLDTLTDAIDDISEYLKDPEDQNHLMKITTELQRCHDFLALVTGTGDAGQGPVTKLGPAKTIGGKKIEYKVSTKLEDVNPDGQKVNALKAKVEALFEKFLTIDSEDLVKNYEDTVIRGVAKKAKMKGITKENPARVTIDFVDQIKMEIMEEEDRQEKLKAELDAKKQPVGPEETITPVVDFSEGTEIITENPHESNS